MAIEQRFDFPRATFDQAVQASMLLFKVYGWLNKDQIEEDKINDREVAQSLEELASGVMRQEIKSHKIISQRVRGIVPHIGVFGGLSMEIDLASFKLVYAIKENLRNFTDNDLIMSPQTE